MLRFAQLVGKLNEWTGKVFSFYLAFLTAVLVYEVVSRYIFNAPTIWAHEAGGLLFLVGSMLGGGYCLLLEAHVRVDVLYSRFSPRVQAITNIVFTPAMLLICYVLLWYGWKGALSSVGYRETSSTLWAPPLYHVKVLVAVGVVLFTLQVLAKIIRDVHTIISRRESA